MGVRRRGPSPLAYRRYLDSGTASPRRRRFLRALVARRRLGRYFLTAVRWSTGGGPWQIYAFCMVVRGGDTM